MTPGHNQYEGVPLRADREDLMSTNRICWQNVSTIMQNRRIQWTSLKLAATAIAIAASVGAPPSAAQEKPGIQEHRATAEEAYLYGISMIVGYKVMHDFFIDQSSGQFKAPINEINNEARVFTPEDTSISTCADPIQNLWI